MVSIDTGSRGFCILNIISYESGHNMLKAIGQSELIVFKKDEKASRAADDVFEQFNVDRFSGSFDLSDNGAFSLFEVRLPME